MYSQFDPYATNVKAIKGYFKNGKVLAVGIILLLGALSAAAYTAAACVSGTAPLEGVLTGYDSPAELFISGACLTGVSAAMLLLFGIGFIKTRGQSRSDKGSPKKVSGFLFAASVICLPLIICIIAYHAFLYRNIIKCVFTRGSIIPGAAFIAMYVICLLYAVSQICFFASVRRSMRSVELSSKGARFFGCMNVFIAIQNAILIVFPAALVFASSEKWDIYAWLLIAEIAVYAVAVIFHILLASVSFGYHMYIEKMRSGYNGAEYQGFESIAPVRRVETVKTRNTSGEADLQKNPYADLFSAQPAQETQENERFDDLFDDTAATDSAETAAEPVCPKCGGVVPEGSGFCNHCGEKL